MEYLKYFVLLKTKKKQGSLIFNFSFYIGFPDTRTVEVFVCDGALKQSPIFCFQGLVLWGLIFRTGRGKWFGIILTHYIYYALHFYDAITQLPQILKAFYYRQDPPTFKV